MCSNFFINGHEFTCFGKLAKFLGGKNKVPIDVGYGDRDIRNYKTCLCPVDIQALVNQLGQRAVTDGINIFFGDDADKVSEDNLCEQAWEVK